MRLDDLTPADRAAVQRGAVSSPTRVTAAARASGPPRARGRTRYRCATCDALSTSYRAAERHADEHGGARIVLDLEALS